MGSFTMPDHSKLYYVFKVRLAKLITDVKVSRPNCLKDI